MDSTLSLTEQLSSSANEFWNVVGGYLPKILSALLLLILALVVAKLVKSLVVKVLSIAGVKKLFANEKVTKTLKTAEVHVDPVDVAGRLSFWVVIIIFALTISDVLELDAMRDVVAGLLGYLPNVLAAAIVATVTIAGARLIRDVVAGSLNRMRIDYAKQIGSIVFALVVIFGALMTVDQLGFDTTILSNNITIIVAGFVFAFSLAFGLGGRDTAGKIVEDGYRHLKSNKKK